jgi:hypothetical protein
MREIVDLSSTASNATKTLRRQRGQRPRVRGLGRFESVQGYVLRPGSGLPRQLPKKLTVLAVEVCPLPKAGNAHGGAYLNPLPYQQLGVRNTGVSQNVAEFRAVSHGTNDTLNPLVRSADLERRTAANRSDLCHRRAHIWVFLQQFPGDPLDLRKCELDIHDLTSRAEAQNRG